MAFNFDLRWWALSGAEQAYHRTFLQWCQIVEWLSWVQCQPLLRPCEFSLVDSFQRLSKEGPWCSKDVFDFDFMAVDEMQRFRRRARCAPTERRLDGTRIELPEAFGGMRLKCDVISGRGVSLWIDPTPSWREEEKCRLARMVWEKKLLLIRTVGNKIGYKNYDDIEDGRNVPSTRR